MLMFCSVRSAGALPQAIWEPTHRTGLSEPVIVARTDAK